MASCEMGAVTLQADILGGATDGQQGILGWELRKGGWWTKLFGSARDSLEPPFRLYLQSRGNGHRLSIAPSSLSWIATSQASQRWDSS